MSPMESLNDDDDPSFTALPHKLRKRIDDAFDAAVSSGMNTGAASPSDPSQPRKRRKVAADQTDAGGFIPATPGGFFIDDPPPGGFLVDDSELDGPAIESTTSPNSPNHGSSHEEVSSSTHGAQIPLSLIPTALQLLDLQPDDPDVLAVFKNAASGWGNRLYDRGEPDEQFVSRKDWRAVCAALLDTGVRSDGDRSDADDAQVDDDEGSTSEDEYMISDDEVSDPANEMDDSDDEYQEGGFMTAKPKGKSKRNTQDTGRRKSQKTSRATSLSNSEDGSGGFQRPRGLTARQKQECRRAFSLFFPDVSDEDLDRQRIKIKDITRVAKLLKEKITAEEIVEMLEAFSSSSDKTMNLADFERMMVTAKLA